MHTLHRPRLNHSFPLAIVAAIATVVLMVAITGMSHVGSGQSVSRAAAPAGVTLAATGPSAEPATKSPLPQPFTAPVTLPWAPNPQETSRKP